jgi:DNA mismatch repair protein MutS
LDPAALQARTSNWLAAVAWQRAGWGLALLDVSTGDLMAAAGHGEAALLVELARFEPRELITDPALKSDALDAAVLRARIVRSRVDEEIWDADEALAELREALGVAEPTGFGLSRDGADLVAVGAVLRYARRSLGGVPKNVHRVRMWSPTAHLVVDETTRRNLELERNLRGERRGTLFELLDQAATPMGSRRLREWLALPMLDVRAVRERQAAVGELVSGAAVREALRGGLREVSDVERLVARVSQGSAHGRDLAALRRSLEVLPGALAAVEGIAALQGWRPADACADVAAEIATWLVDEPPLALTDGGLIREGADGALDEITELSLQARAVVSRLEEKERAATGIGPLKIRPHGTLGLVFEVPVNHAAKVPPRFLPRQHTSNLVRFQTTELQELHERLAGADVRRKGLEYQLFVALRERVAKHGARLLALARQLADLDALAALAEVAVRRRWCRPVLADDLTLEIEAGRHPVVEAHLPEGRFVANDVRLDPATRRFIVLTGPNMAGKSTILRQVAIIVLLAHMGSWVPAERAVVGAADRIFTRVGASDDLAHGQSTFMVEMAETAAILHQATHRSLVLLDEIGRGTSTYDGLSIAWAVAEDLVDRVGCRAMFATHYHELCELAETRPAVANQSVAVSESGDQILFLRTLKEGGASRSYGIQCGRLAGLPAQVVTRARGLLRHFEKHAPRNERQQLSLFGGLVVAAEEPEPAVDALREALRGLDPDKLSPREALDALYRLRSLA